MRCARDATAAALGVARGRLDRLFAAELGRSVGCEVLRQRIALAKDLLAGTGKRLDEIARETGFCNPSYLIKRFRAATGLTPLEWSASRTTPCDIAEIGGKW